MRSVQHPAPQGPLPHPGVRGQGVNHRGERGDHRVRCGADHVVAAGEGDRFRVAGEAVVGGHSHFQLREHRSAEGAVGADRKPQVAGVQERGTAGQVQSRRDKEIGFPEHCAQEVGGGGQPVAGPSGRDEPVVDRCEGVFRGQQVGTAPLPGVTLVSGPGERPEAQVRQRSEPERRHKRRLRSQAR